ncbi:PhoX family phosphatase [Nitrosomonas sp.]|uniref:PhoX family protein n=1 Tax=Nitrosomonas sp. TaxID=42353 RepID=UPI001D400EAC|nr:PhoX family phosphatase [Nitrosomonas sp.]MCB1949455.1 PhoX family phosphatase [Nitrosomonas sp.]
MSSTLHPDSKTNPSKLTVNDSGNQSISDIIEQRQLSRRGFLKSSAGAAAGVSASAVLGACAPSVLAKRKNTYDRPAGEIGFTAVSPNTLPMIDGVTVPEGYTARVLVSWGDSLTMKPHWDTADAMDEAIQLHAFGAHTDGMHYFPMPGPLGNWRGLLVANSEYCDPPLVNNITPASEYANVEMTLEMVRAQQAAHGVNIMMINKKRRQWEINRRSPFNRRITGNTPCTISGPAAGHALMKTAMDFSGRHVLGTLNNCAHGYTPWGTYLTCEENWNGYFGSQSETFSPSLHESRYGISKNGFGYRWHEVDERFDVNIHRNEPNRFGWVVEIDPFNPWDTPVKRTALGRFKHESAMVVMDNEGQVAVYMGDDERNEYVYKFVSASKMKRGNAASNRNLLDEGILYVARFNADGSGEWLPLVWGQNGLTPENGFADQAEVLIKTRQASDRLGATMMDRPEWVAAHPVTNEIYLTLTNNNRRGSTPVSGNSPDGTSSAGSARPAVDAANPRPDNDFGHIIRWRDDRGNVSATHFEWDIFVQCGDKNTTKTLGGSYNPDGHDGYTGNINGDDYGAPDGLWFDREGRLWVQTDQAGDAAGDWINIGGNVMMCADPVSGETKRFLTSPPNSEVTGVVTTPDGRTMFVGIQHPGEDWEINFTDNSTWPDNGHNGLTTFNGTTVCRPRSSIIVITKDDEGVIGS